MTLDTIKIKTFSEFKKMCDTQTLGKLFLWGGYCYKHFHPTTTAAPTTSPTTTPPTTTPPSCSPCSILEGDSKIFNQDDLQRLCDQGTVEIPGTFFTGGNRCGETFEIQVTALPKGITCPDPPNMGQIIVTAIGVTVIYLGETGSSRLTIDAVQEGEELCLGNIVNVCVDFNTQSQVVDFQAARGCRITGVRVSNIIVDCENACK